MSARSPTRAHATAQRSLRGKPRLHRSATAVGEILLSSRSRRAIREGRVEKGDPGPVAALAGMSAMKRTAELLPHCHIVPLTGSRVEVRLTGRGMRATATAEAEWSTGVEMESLVGATVALLTVWDMVKYLEKDARGQYPVTSVGPVRVVEKRKVPLAQGH